MDAPQEYKDMVQQLVAESGVEGAEAAVAEPFDYMTRELSERDI